MDLIGPSGHEFDRLGIATAQVLLTHDDLQDRRRYINARSTLRTLLEWGVIPVVNENDTVATEEIRFGDNDSLAALVTNLVEAQLLVILTDQAGLYDRDPLTDDGQVALRLLRGPIAEHDETRRIDASLADGDEAVVSLALELSP